jgi:nucleoside-diphosphate-sugar epimerase
MNMRELARLIFEAGRQRGMIPAAGELRFEHLPTFADDVRVRVPAIDKARQILGWAPQVAARESIERCVNVAIDSLIAAAPPA